MSLFTAVNLNNLEILNLILAKQPNIDLNEKIYKGETSLLRSIRKRCSYPIISRLIQMGCDVNIPNEYYETPLHLAVLHQMNEIALELIKHEANINAQDNNKATPLYYAICDNNIEIINMLLYYGADLTILSSHNRTPLMQAIQMSQPTLLVPLIRYYDELAHFKELDENSIVTSLNYIGIGDWINCEDRLFLRFAIEHGSFELFKLIWFRIDHEKLLRGSGAFLKLYFVFSSFTSSEWKQCMKLILASPQALGLVYHYTHTDFGRLYPLMELINAFKKHNIEKNSRVAVLYTLFSLGMEIGSYDLASIMFEYGCDEEYEACIYVSNYCGSKSDWKTTFHTFIFSLEQDCNVQTVFRLLKNNQSHVQSWYRFFSLLPDMKESLNSPWYGISRQLSYMPEMPTLLELARNATQSFIRNNNEISRPYQFHDIVKGLCLPNKIKNVILFKQHLY